jgi:glycerophosphoryl diester phosphodiesterase
MFSSLSPPLAIAHRGSRLLWPENTMAAFSGAVEMGYTFLETDLRITADRLLVCFHDPTVDRTTDAQGPVSSYTWDDLRRLDAGFRYFRQGDYPFRAQGIGIPSLEELMTTFPKVRLVTDLKEDGTEELLAELVERLGIHDRLVVGSFSDRRLARFRRLTHGEVATSTGQKETFRAWTRAQMRRPIGGDAQALQIPTTWYGMPLVGRPLVSAAHREGIQVHVWTVNETEEMERLLTMGVDGIITDRPDLLREVLIRRQAWSG